MFWDLGNQDISMEQMQICRKFVHDVHRDDDDGGSSSSNTYLPTYPPAPSLSLRVCWNMSSAYLHLTWCNIYCVKINHFISNTGQSCIQKHKNVYVSLIVLGSKYVLFNLCPVAGRNCCVSSTATPPPSTTISSTLTDESGRHICSAGSTGLPPESRLANLQQ